MSQFAPNMERAISSDAEPRVEARVILDNDVLRMLRRVAIRYLPYWAAEDCVADMVIREWEESKRIGREGYLRCDHLTPTWVRLECRSWRERVEAKRLKALDEVRDDSDQTPDMEDEDIIERPADADELESDEPRRRVGAWEAWEASVDLAARLGIQAIPGAYECLAQGLTDLPARTLAERLGLDYDQFAKRVSRARKVIRSQVTPTDVWDVIDYGPVARTRGLAVRSPITRWADIGKSERPMVEAIHRIGREDAKSPRNDTPATVLLAKPQAPGFRASSGGLAEPTESGKVPDSWASHTTGNLDTTRMARILRKHLRSAGKPRSGPRPVYPVRFPAASVEGHTEPKLTPDGRAFIERCWPLKLRIQRPAGIGDNQVIIGKD